MEHFQSPPCSVCQRQQRLKKSPKALKDGSAAAPFGWKRFGGQLWCASCWAGHWRIVALTLPASEILAAPEAVSGMERKEQWKELWQECRKVWRQCGHAMSWAMLQHYAADTQVRIPDHLRNKDENGKVRIGPYKPVYLYRDRDLSGDKLRELWPEIRSGSMSALDDHARKLYAADRWELFTGRRQLRAFGEQPLPLRGQDYSLSIDESDGIRRVAMSFPLGPGRWTIALGNRRRFARQLAAIERVIAGEGVQVEAQVLEKAAGRRGFADREAGGARRRKREIAVKIVCWLPKKHAAEADGVLLLRTMSSSFMFARILGDDRDQRWTHEDQMVRAEMEMRERTAGHRRRLQRLSDDTKIERRIGIERPLNDRLDELCEKHRRRIDTFLHQKSHQIAEMAERLGCGEVVYDDSDKTWISSFPWSRLWTMTEQKCNAANVRLLSAEQKKAEYERAKEIERWQDLAKRLGEVGTRKENGDDGNNNEQGDGETAGVSQLSG